MSLRIASKNVLSFALKHGSTFGAYMITGKILQLPMSTAELGKYSGIGASVGVVSHLAECSPARNDFERCPGCSVETDLKVRKFLIRWVVGSFPFLTHSSYWKILGYSFLFSAAFEVATELLECCISSCPCAEISRSSFSFRSAEAVSNSSSVLSQNSEVGSVANYSSLGPNHSDLV